MVNQSKAWVQLKKHFNDIEPQSIASFFGDKNRTDTFSLSLSSLYLDFSKNKIDSTTVALLVKLAEQQSLKTKINELLLGENVNHSENRPALHTALRVSPSLENSSSIDRQSEIETQLKKMDAIVNKIRVGQWRGATGKKITDVVNIGVGGSDLGPLMVVHALQNTISPVELHFISSIDGTQFAKLLKQLNQETTLFIIASKSFTTIDTLANSETVLQWLKEKIHNTSAIYSQHFIGVSANKKMMAKWGLSKSNQLLIWDWVGGRYSMWSSIGLSIALKIGMDGFRKFLAGANKMDIHFATEPFKQNIPVMMALINIWNINFLNINKKAILPYDARLKYLPAYLSQLVMESNGKQVNHSGETVNYKTCPILWGEVGPNAQHAFFQLLHQGTQKVMCDFIAIIDRDDFDTDSKGTKEVSLKKQHDLALANCFAQSRVLMMGDDAIPDKLKEKFNSPFKHYPGEQPSNTILLDSISPKNMGMLIALYEHITFVESVIWEINPFDQWGVELGKLIAQETYQAIQGTNYDFDASTESLINKVKR